MHPKSAEIKLTVTESQVELALALLPLPVDSDQWQIFFCEDVSRGVSAATPLLDVGVVLRARKKANDPDPDDSTIKLRPCRRSQLANRWLAAHDVDGFKVEADWAGSRKVLAASYTADLGKARLDDVRDGAKEVSSLFTKEQTSFLAACSVVPVNLDAVTLLPPVGAVRWQPFQEPLAGQTWDLRAERWTVDALDFLELSIVAKIDDAAPVQAAFESFVRSRGLAIHDSQETKTRRVLEHLVRKVT
jgi:hypothetical protein